MLELIFQGFVEWIYGMVLECWEYFASMLLQVMSMDFAYLKSHIPVLPEIQQILLAVGWALLIGNLVFQALKSMSTGLGFEGEDPKLLFTRTFVFAFLLLASPQICEIGLNMTQTIINYLDMPDAVNITLADDATFVGLRAAWLLVVICGLIIMFKVFKLILEIAERYIILAILTLCAPLAFGMGGSRNTSDIFTGWCRMFGSMCLVMVTNVIFFKMLLSVLSFVPSGLDVLPWMILVFGIVKVAKKIDAIITRIGLNPAITGDGLGGRSLPGMLTYAVVRAVGQQVAKSAGKNAGGRSHGGSTAPPGGGGPNGPRTGPVSGGPRFASTAGTAGRPAGAGTPSGQQVGAVQGNQTPGTPGQPGTVVETSTQLGGQPHTDPRQQGVGATVSGNVDGRIQNATVQQHSDTRKTSVKPGTRRGASHIPASGRPGMAGMGFLSQTGRVAGGTAGIRSGMAGTGRPKTDALRGFSGTAEKATTGPVRLTALSSQQVNEGGADSRVVATEQNRITIPQGGQPKSAAPDRRSPASPHGQGSTRFTRRHTGSVHTNESSAAVRRGQKVESPAQVRSASPSGGDVSLGGQGMTGTRRADPSGPASDPIRHSRNTLRTGSSSRSSDLPHVTARQERPSTGTHPASKVTGPAVRPGTAGTGTRQEKTERTRQTARKQASASKSTSTATGMSRGRRPSSGTPARQEQRRPDERKSGRKPGNGGIKDGK